jgi:toxin ParE1/3/4
MNRVRTSSAADRDIVECAVWFEKQKPGLGSDFLDAVDEALTEIAVRPLACPTFVLEGPRLKVDLRSLRLGRFPQLVIFEAASNEAVIYAVVHPHRDLETLLRARVGIR